MSTVSRTLLRYPGNKSRLVRQLVPFFPLSIDGYCEPFVGSGTVLFALLPQIARGSRILLNDLDPGMFALWCCVRYAPDDLARRIMAEPTPTVERFNWYYDQPTPDAKVEAAFRHLFLHHTSYSGLGRIARSPIGGQDQRGNYPIGCRWFPEYRARVVRDAHDRLAEYDCVVTNVDAVACVEAASDLFCYIDPPYMSVGDTLYTTKFTGHKRLAAVLRTRDRWVLSYDDDSRVREDYEWATIKPIRGHYTMGVKGPTAPDDDRDLDQELVIVPPGFHPPQGRLFD